MKRQTKIPYLVPGKFQVAAELLVHGRVERQTGGKVHEVALREADDVVGVGDDPGHVAVPLAELVEAVLLAVVEVWRPGLAFQPGICLDHGNLDFAQVDTVLFAAGDQDYSLQVLDCPGDLQCGEEVLDHCAWVRSARVGRKRRSVYQPTIHLPVLLLRVLLQIGSKEDILAPHIFEIPGHVLGRTRQVDVVVHDVGRIFILLAARQRMYGFPFLVILPQLLDDLSSENPFEEDQLHGFILLTEWIANLPVAPVTMAVDMVGGRTLNGRFQESKMSAE